MRGSSQRRLSEIKESLRSYISDMFSSMLASFTATLQTQFAKLQQAYSRCVKERNILFAEQESLQKMKKSIANLFTYVDQLEKEMALSSITSNTKNEYYECKRDEGSNDARVPLSDRSALRFNSNLATAASSSSKKFERKTGSRGILKSKVSTQDQKENVGLNLYEHLYHKNSAEYQNKRT